MYCANNYSRAFAKSEILLISSIIGVIVFLSVDKIGRIVSMKAMAILTLISFLILTIDF